MPRTRPRPWPIRWASQEIEAIRTVAALEHDDFPNYIRRTVLDEVERRLGGRVSVDGHAGRRAR